MSRSTALAKVELPASPIARVDELHAAISRIEGQCNLLMPLAAQDYIPPYHRVSLRAVHISEQDTYVDRQWCQNGERAIGKTGLMKILRARGASVLWSKRTDDRHDPHYVEWSVMIRATETDGHTGDFPGSKEIDLRDGSSEASKMSEKQLVNARRHMLAMAETKALNRAIRGLCGLQQKYSMDALQKPFVTLALVPDLPMDDPEVRRQVVASMLQSQSALYGGAPAQQQSAGPQLEAGDVEPETIDLSDDDEPEVMDAEPVVVDPWDEDPAAAPSCVLPIDVDQIPTNDERRFQYAERLNAYYQRLAEACGEDQAAAIVTKHSPAEGSPITWPLEDLAVLGKAIAAALERAA